MPPELAGLWAPALPCGCLAGLFWGVGVFGGAGHPPSAQEQCVLGGTHGPCVWHERHPMGAGFPCRLSPCPLRWVPLVTGQTDGVSTLRIWGCAASAPIFWELYLPGAPLLCPWGGGHAAVVPNVALPSLLLHAGAWLLVPVPVPPLSHVGTPIPGRALCRGLFWVGFAENPKEKHQLTALRGAETWGLIGSILGEFFWRAVWPPLPERWGFRVSPVVSAAPALSAFCHLCFGVNPSRMRTIRAGRDVGSPRMEVGWCRMLLSTSAALGWGFCGGMLAFPQKTILLRANPAYRWEQACPYRGRGAAVSCFGGKLRHGGGQNRVLPLPSRGRAAPASPSPLCPMAARACWGLEGGTQGTSPRLALARRAVSGRRRLSCARRLAWGGGSLPRCSRRDPRGQVGDTEGSASRSVEGTFWHSDCRSGHPKSLPLPPSPPFAGCTGLVIACCPQGWPVPGSCPLSLGGAVKRNLLFLFISAKARQRGLPR